MDDKELFWNLYHYNMARGEHHQDQRATVTNLILVLAGALITVIALDEKLAGTTDSWAAIFLAGVGFWGILFGLKHHERYSFYLHRARGYRQRLIQLVGDTHIIDINKAADAETKEKYGRLYDIELWPLWVGLHAFVSVLGVILACLSLSGCT